MHVSNFTNDNWLKKIMNKLSEGKVELSISE